MNSRVILIFLAIIVSGLVLRLIKLDIPLLEFYPTRQIQTAEITRNLYSGGFNLLSPSVNYLGPDSKLFLVEFPGYNFIVAILYKIVGAPHEYLGRIFSITGWLVASIMLFLIAKKVAGTFVATIALLFYSFFPLSVLVSRSFQPDQWMLTLTLLSFYFIEKSGSKKSRFAWYLSALFISLAVLTKLPAIIFTLVGAGYYLLKTKKFPLVDKFLFLLLATLPSLIWYFYVARVNSNVVNLQNSIEISTWFGLDVLINPKYFSSIFGFEYYVGLLPVGILFFLIGLASKLKPSQYFLYWWLGGIILYFLFFNKHNMTHEYYHLPFLPIAAIFIGIGCEKLITNFNNLLISKTTLIIIFSILIFTLMLPPTLARAYKPIERFKYVPETAQKIRTFTRPGDLVIGAMDGGPALVYYSMRPGWFFDINRTEVSEQDLIFDFKPEISSSVDELEILRGQGAKVFASANIQQFLTNSQFSQYMYKRYPVLFENDNYIIFNLEKTDD